MSSSKGVDISKGLCPMTLRSVPMACHEWSKFSIFFIVRQHSSAGDERDADIAGCIPDQSYRSPENESPFPSSLNRRKQRKKCPRFRACRDVSLEIHSSQLQ